MNANERNLKSNLYHLLLREAWQQESFMAFIRVHLRKIRSFLGVACGF